MSWIPVVTAAVTAVFGFLGTYLANKKQAALMAYRLEQLEKKVDKHNNLVERMFRAEGAITEIQHDMSELKERF